MALFGAAGCSTVETRRADPPTLVAATARPLSELQTCLSDGFDRLHQVPNFVPTAGGGTYTLSGQGYVQWVIDIHDVGGRHEIVVHAITTMWGKDKRLIALVQGCA